MKASDYQAWRNDEPRADILDKMLRYLASEVMAVYMEIHAGPPQYEAPVLEGDSYIVRWRVPPWRLRVVPADQVPWYAEGI